MARPALARNCSNSAFLLRWSNYDQQISPLFISQLRGQHRVVWRELRVILSSAVKA
jgi:hypothetical protein